MGPIAIVYSPSYWRRALVDIQPIVRGFWCTLLKVSKYNSTFPRSSLAKLELYFETFSKMHQFKNTESHSYSYERAFYSYTSMKAYKQVKNTENLTSTSPEKKPSTTAVTGSKKYSENLTSTTLENNITAALTGSKKYGKPDEYNTMSALTGSECSRSLHGGSRWQVSEFTNLFREEIFAKFPCRKQLPFAMPNCLPLISCVFVVFLQPYCS